MAEITAALVKVLREKTGAGMMDCKQALGETGGDIEGAVDWLRKKGLAAAAKKAGRVAAEGLVGVTTRGGAGAVVEVNSETDFVARNELFQAFVRAVGQLALSGDGTLEGVQNAAYRGTGRTVAAELTELLGRIGENLVLRRVARLQREPGVEGDRGGGEGGRCADQRRRLCALPARRGHRPADHRSRRRRRRPAGAVTPLIPTLSPRAGRGRPARSGGRVRGWQLSHRR